MNEINIKDIIINLIDTFLYAGKVSLELREKGLTKEIKSDNTPVSNGDLEVNKIVTQKLLELTPNIPIVSEETSHNKSSSNLENFWLVDLFWIQLYLMSPNLYLIIHRPIKYYLPLLYCNSWNICSKK